MKRILRLVLIGTVSLALLFVGIAAFALFVVDPNAFKPQIQALAMKSMGKKLEIPGDISLSFFPRLQIQAGPATLLDDPAFGAQPFMHMEKVNASVALFPLLKRKIEIGDVQVSGVRIKLAVDKDGKNNWTMQQENDPSPSPGPAPLPDTIETDGQALSFVALQSLVVTDATLVYADIPARSDMVVNLKKLEVDSVKTGKKSTLKLEAEYAGALANPVRLAVVATFALPQTLAQGSQVTADGKLDDIPFTFQGLAALPGGLTLKGDLDIGAIDANKYAAAPAKSSLEVSSTAPPAATGPTSTASSGSSQTDAAPVGLVQSLFLDLHLKVQSLTVGKFPANTIEATIRADQGLVTAKPLSFDLNGPIRAEATIDARGKALQSRVIGSWKNVPVATLARAFTGKAPITGSLNADWNISATGTSWQNISKTLGGKASVLLTNGNIPALKLIPAGFPGLPPTTIDLANVESTSNWSITKGIASNRDLKVKALGLNATGEGQINIPLERIDYKLLLQIPAIKELPDFTVLPVSISGPLQSPSYDIDESAILRQTAKKILAPVAKEVEKELGRALKDLLRR